MNTRLLGGPRNGRPANQFRLAPDKFMEHFGIVDDNAPDCDVYACKFLHLIYWFHSNSVVFCVVFLSCFCRVSVVFLLCIPPTSSRPSYRIITGTRDALLFKTSDFWLALLAISPRKPPLASLHGFMVTDASLNQIKERPQVCSINCLGYWLHHASPI